MKINKILSSYYILSFACENDIIRFYKAFNHSGVFKIMRLKPIYGKNAFEYCAKLPKNEDFLLAAGEYCKLKRIKKHQFAALFEHSR